MRDEEEFVRYTSGQRASMRDRARAGPGKEVMNLKIFDYGWNELFLRDI